MPVKPLKLPAHDPKVKKIILEGVSILQSQSNPNVAKVAQELTATHGIVCPYTTLFRRFNGKTLAASDAHIHQQLLTPAALLIGSFSLVKRVMASVSLDYVPVSSKHVEI
jgi:hypothetical protein